MKFVDGPAAGTVLSMRRCPLLLRVVRNTLARTAEKAWDCLNDPGDQAKPHEEIHVYILREKPGIMHLSMRPRGGSGWYGVGEHFHLTPLPVGVTPFDEITLRDNDRWSAWCDANREHLMPAWYRAEAEKAKEADYG